MRHHLAALPAGERAIAELEIWRTPHPAPPRPIEANGLAELNILVRLVPAASGGSRCRRHKRHKHGHST